MASRDTTTAFNNLLDDTVVKPFFAVELLFQGTPLRLWTGEYDLTIGSITYLGVGSLIGISEIEETSDIAARGANLVLSGVDSSNLSLALGTAYQGRRAKILFGFFDSSGNPQTVEIFSGYMDEMNIEEGPQTSTVEIKLENKLVDLERPRVRRYTSGYQKSKYPSDKGLDFVEGIQDQSVVWVKK